MNVWEPRTANSEKPLIILPHTGVINYGRSNVDVVGAPYVGGLRGLAGPAVVVLTAMKTMDNRYPHFTSGFRVLSSKAASQHQGGIALLWRENHPGVEVEVTRILTPNLLTFQLVTGNERYYCMGVYIPPNDIMGVEDLPSAWDACPAGCIPIISGDLNIDFETPTSNWRSRSSTSLTRSI